MKTDWRTDYKRRYAMDEGELIASSDHDWTIRTVGDRFVITCPGEVSRSADTLQEAKDIIHDLTITI